MTPMVVQAGHSAHPLPPARTAHSPALPLLPAPRCALTAVFPLAAPTSGLDSHAGAKTLSPNTPAPQQPTPSKANVAATTRTHTSAALAIYLPRLPLPMPHTLGSQNPRPFASTLLLHILGSRMCIQARNRHLIPHPASGPTRGRQERTHPSTSRLAL